jgi:aerobic-type carbon monoxide dehydrogenase small subunit (CoxS/CutS family)
MEKPQSTSPPQAVRFTLNGREVTAPTGAARTLLWVLRTEFALTGAKYGCGEGFCGACTVLIDGVATPSCLISLAEVANKSVLTIEGLAHDGQLHPLQQAFIDHGAFQCGYCTSGMLLGAMALLQRTSKPSREAIASELEGHLCRCGAHQRILDAVESVAAPSSRVS